MEMEESNGEVRPMRRVFTVEFKRNLVAEIDATKSSEEVGLILRREGLHSTQVHKWRRQLRVGALGAAKRGAKPKDELARRNMELESEVTELKARLALADELIEAQGKVWALLHEKSDKSASPRSPK
jgi:transposase-like protein